MSTNRLSDALLSRVPALAMVLSLVGAAALLIVIYARPDLLMVTQNDDAEFVTLILLALIGARLVMRDLQTPGSELDNRTIAELTREMGDMRREIARLRTDIAQVGTRPETRPPERS